MCFDQILFIGPSVKPLDNSGQGFQLTNREGIGHVLSSYAKHIHPFKYISCFKPEASILASLWVFLNGAAALFYHLLVDQEIKIVHILDEVKTLDQRTPFKRYWVNDFLGKLVLCILVRIVLQKRFVYHINGDGISSIYGKRRGIGKSIMRKFFFLTEMVLCTSEEDLAFFKGNFNCKLVFIIPEGIELLEDRSAPHSDGSLIKLLYLGSIVSEAADKGNGGDRELKTGNYYLKKSLSDILNLVDENRRLYKGKLMLLIGGVQAENDYDNVGAGKLEHKLLAGGDPRHLIANRTGHPPGFATKQIYDLIRQKHLEDLVAYVDCTMPRLKSRLFKMADICFVPAMDVRGRTRYLEAMNYGLPIIAPAVGSNCEMVLNGINGFLIPPDHKGGFSSAIGHFLLHPSDTVLMGAASKELVQKFDIQSVLLKLKFIYSNLLN